MKLTKVTKHDGTTILVRLECLPDLGHNRQPAGLLTPAHDDNNNQSAQVMDSETWAHWGM